MSRLRHGEAVKKHIAAGSATEPQLAKLSHSKHQALSHTSSHTPRSAGGEPLVSLGKPALHDRRRHRWKEAPQRRVVCL